MPGAPTFGDVLKKMVVYFTYPNPDGWRRGSVSAGRRLLPALQRQRRRPQPRLARRRLLLPPVLDGVGARGPRARQRAAGDRQRQAGRRRRRPARDAHRRRALVHADRPRPPRLGEGHAHPRDRAQHPHRLGEGARLVAADRPERHADKEHDGLRRRGRPPRRARQIYGQTWGTVYDTINYTVTGSLGDWLDSPFGLGADGLDNEMAFSHLDRNIVFDPQGEQLHVDGNKALIYAQIASMLNPPDQRYDAPGLKGYVANARRTRRRSSSSSPSRRRARVAQAKITGQNGTPSAGRDRLPVRRSRRDRSPPTAPTRQERLQRRPARRHHEAQRPGHQRRQRRHDAEGPVQVLRRPPRRRARRRSG